MRTPSAAHKTHRHQSRLTGTNQLSVTFVLALVISENKKQTKRAYDQNQSPLSERPNQIPSVAELVLDPSEVLLNLLIATGFSGAITKTLSHSTVHWLLRGMSVSCVMTEVNESQYFVFYFHNPHYKRLTSSWIHECLHTCALTNTQLGVYMQEFLKTRRETNIFLSSLHLLLSALNTNSVVSTRLFASQSSLVNICLTRPSVQSDASEPVCACLCV